MPRPNLSSMSVDALLKLREDVNKILDRKEHELRSQLSMLDGGSVRQQQASSLIPCGPTSARSTTRQELDGHYKELRCAHSPRALRFDLP